MTLAQFQDDTQRSRLRTLLARLTPTEVLLEHGQHTAETAGTLRLVAPRAAYEVLRGDEMPSADEARRRLQAGKYFPEVPVRSYVRRGVSASPLVFDVLPPPIRAVSRAVRGSCRRCWAWWKRAWPTGRASWSCAPWAARCGSSSAR